VKEELVRTRPRRIFGLLAAALFVAAACGPSSSSTGPTVPPTPRVTFNPATLPPVAQQTFHIPPFSPAALRWYCCLGAGDAPEQQPGEKDAAKGFATKYPGSSLKIEITGYDAAVDVLSTQLGGGNPPDVSGPNGIGGLASFKGQWTDLAPYLSQSAYDLTVYDQATIDFFKQDGAQIGVPFDLYPSMLWYKRDFFDEAGIAEPPHEFGAKYKQADGTEVEWNYDTLRQIAMKLTVDKSGKDATQAGFDPGKIDQWGFEPQRDVLLGMGAFWGPCTVVGPDGKTVVIPDSCKAAWKFIYDGVWKDHFIMNEAEFNTRQVDQGFFSGKVAMAENFLWTTYGVAGAGKDWDLAAIPSYNGKVTAPLNADTFSVFKSSKNQDAAFAAMVYLLQDSSRSLLPLYGGIPARTAEQDAFFDSVAKTEGFPADVDWTVAKAAIKYADIPNFEAPMPAYNKSLKILDTYRNKWFTDSTKGKLNMDQEFEALRAELQAAWDAG
jgi:multiple sugar transport system substrate-binding protein